MTRKEERKLVYEKYKGKCSYCGRKITLTGFEIDHFIPKRAAAYAKKHGVELESLSNKVPSCRVCNHYKRGNLPESFRKIMMSLHTRVEKIYIVKVAQAFGMLDVLPFDGVFHFEKCKKK